MRDQRGLKRSVVGCFLIYENDPPGARHAIVEDASSFVIDASTHDDASIAAPRAPEAVRIAVTSGSVTEVRRGAELRRGRLWDSPRRLVLEVE
jgi:hypothetical protein